MNPVHDVVMSRSTSDGRDAGLLQTRLGHLLPELNRVFLVLASQRRQRTRLDDVVDGVDEEPPTHLCVVHDRHHGVEAPFVDREGAAEVALDVVPGDLVLGERRRCGGNADGLLHVAEQVYDRGRLRRASVGS